MTNIEDLKNRNRELLDSWPDDEDLGPFSHLSGRRWVTPNRGWNMIALPFAQGGQRYRLLMNQYAEELEFKTVDKGIKNRGIDTGINPDHDQVIVGIDYQQKITQIAADDRPQSGLAGNPGQVVHHEPGLFLHMKNRTTEDLDIARLATIPHGDSVLALGRSVTMDGPPIIPELSGLPIGVTNPIDDEYMEPYKDFRDQPFENLFDPTKANELLRRANNGVNIVRHTKLEFDTRFGTGVIVNIPFVVEQANATEMQSTFWISELIDDNGEPALQLQYSQTVMLEFFDRNDGEEGLIKWPHISINTLRVG